jgi:elongation factor G
MKDAMNKAGHVLLEPIMRLEVHTPVNYMGDVLNNLHVRRAVIEEMGLLGELQVIRGYAPLAEMFGYANELRTVSQGRATYTMEPCKYAAVPEGIQSKFAEAWDFSDRD